VIDGHCSPPERDRAVVAIWMGAVPSKLATDRASVTTKSVSDLGIRQSLFSKG
jgi:hypothetical protein